VIYLLSGFRLVEGRCATPDSPKHRVSEPLEQICEFIRHSKLLTLLGLEKMCAIAIFNDSKTAVVRHKLRKYVSEAASGICGLYLKKPCKSHTLRGGGGSLWRSFVHFFHKNYLRFSPQVSNILDNFALRIYWSCQIFVIRPLSNVSNG
jgi:hypothetical protein